MLRRKITIKQADNNLNEKKPFRTRVVFIQKSISIILFFISSFHLASAQTDSNSSIVWSDHFQLTVINQIHSGFKAAYSGMNSLADTVEPSATSVTTTLFLGRRVAPFI